MHQSRYVFSLHFYYFFGYYLIINRVENHSGFESVLKQRTFFFLNKDMTNILKEPCEADSGHKLIKP